jgi:hypothetical protein
MGDGVGDVEVGPTESHETREEKKSQRLGPALATHLPEELREGSTGGSGHPEGGALESSLAKDQMRQRDRHQASDPRAPTPSPSSQDRETREYLYGKRTSKGGSGTTASPPSGPTSRCQRTARKGTMSLTCGKPLTQSMRRENKSKMKDAKRSA